MGESFMPFQVVVPDQQDVTIEASGIGIAHRGSSFRRTRSSVCEEEDPECQIIDGEVYVA